MQAVHGDHVPLVYAFFLLTCYQSTVEYVVADRPCGNTQSFRCNIGVHPSGTSLVTSLVFPLAHAGMVAASSWGREAILGALAAFRCGRRVRVGPRECRESRLGGDQKLATELPERQSYT